MEHKNMVATIYIKDGMAVKSPTELDKKKDVLELASVYDDSGIDKIICYDLSTDDDEHEKNILAIREINRNVQVKTAGTVTCAKAAKAKFVKVYVAGEESEVYEN